MTPMSSSDSSASSSAILMSRSPPPTSSILVSSPSSRWIRPTSRVIWSLICNGERKKMRQYGQMAEKELRVR